MKRSRQFTLAAVAALTTLVTACFAQDASGTGQAAPALSGTGHAGDIAIWKTSNTLSNSILSQSGGNVGIGTATPAAALEVNGDAQIDGNFSLSGSILLTGVGPLIQAPNNGSDNFGAGLGALSATTTGVQNTAVGDNALARNTTGYGNTASGHRALSDNTNGSKNTAIGAFALNSFNTGDGNTAIGNQALSNNLGGFYNMASGYQALFNNTTGIINTASGSFALGFNTTGNGNTASGYGALYLNTTGADNTANGIDALTANSTGNYNTASGYNALYSNHTGNSNIAIGSSAGFNITTTSNNIEIGSQGTATDSGTIRIGTPFVSGCTTCQTSAFIAGVYGSTTGLPGVPVMVDSNGNLGTLSSSRRFKEDVRDMGGASTGLLRLRPVTFRYKKAFVDGSKPVQYGLVAEEVAEVYPDLVVRSADGQVETVKYQLLDPMLLNELQKQHTTITAQQEQIHDQQRQIRSLEERLVRVEAALSGTTVTAAR